MSATQRQCPECKEWYDARSQACYLCGEDERQRNIALERAVHTTNLNSALAQNVGVARGEAGAEQHLRTARNAKDERAFGRPLNVPGYSSLVADIKQALAEQNFGE